MQSFDMTTQINWNLITAITGIIAIIIAIIIPFLVKLYEENKSKRSFKLYVKSKLGNIYNSAAYNTYTYIAPTIKDDPDKELIKLGDFARRLNQDYSNYQNSLQPRILFHFLNNLQNFCFALHKIRTSILSVDRDNITENTLNYGEKLSEQYLKDIYGLTLILDSFISISAFHDRFNEIKSIERVILNNQWVGLKVDEKLLSNQQILSNDMKDVCNKEQNLKELLGVSVVLSDNIEKYYDVAEASILSKLSQEIFQNVAKALLHKIVQ